MWNSWKTGGFSWVSHWEISHMPWFEVFFTYLISPQLFTWRFCQVKMTLIELKPRFVWVSLWSDWVAARFLSDTSLDVDNVSTICFLMFTMADRSSWGVNRCCYDLLLFDEMKMRCPCLPDLSTLSTVAQLGGTAEVGLQNDLQRLLHDFFRMIIYSRNLQFYNPKWIHQI